jgi:hypothetical protein
MSREILDRLSGKIQAAQIFVAVMGASNFTYAEASGAGGWMIFSHERQVNFSLTPGSPSICHRISE